MVTLSRNMINWALTSHEVRLKLLTHGFLFTTIRAIEILLPSLSEQVRVLK